MQGWGTRGKLTGYIHALVMYAHPKEGELRKGAEQHFWYIKNSIRFITELRYFQIKNTAAACRQLGRENCIHCLGTMDPLSVHRCVLGVLQISEMVNSICRVFMDFLVRYSFLFFTFHFIF